MNRLPAWGTRASDAPCGPAEGLTVLVTGGTGGIGSAIAQRLAAAGATLILTARSARTLEALAADLPGRRAAAMPCDFTRADEIDRLVNTALAAPRLDVLVHAAGAYVSGPWEHADDASLRTMLAVNTEAPAILTRRLLPALRSTRGQVVFVNSTRGLDTAAGVGPYAASKHALKAVADGLRLELRGTGVRILSVHNGSTATGMQERIQRDKGGPWDPAAFIQPDDVAAMVMAALTLPRTAEVTEMTIWPSRLLPS